MAYASSLDQIGPLSHSVQDCAWVLQAIAGHDPRDSTSIPEPCPDYASALSGDVSDLVIGLPREYFEADGVEAALAEKGIAVAPCELHAPWQARVEPVLDEAGLAPPEGAGVRSGGRQGRHSEHLGHLLAEFQFMQRAYPGAAW